MGWMSRMLGKGGNAKEQGNDGGQAAVVPGVQYHADLMPGYLVKHQELVALFTVIGDKVQSGDFQSVPAALVAFKTALESHLLSENVRFYSYLEQQFRSTPDNYQLVKSFRVEMRGIARQVVDFIRKWREAGVNANTVDDFMEEYRQVGNVLATRIEAEEQDLYPLYQPPE